jgi:hypothetical protein
MHRAAATPAVLDQHADSLDKVFFPGIVPREIFYQNASVQPVDMNAIAEEMTGLDFRLGSEIRTLQRGPSVV